MHSQNEKSKRGRPPGPSDKKHNKVLARVADIRLTDKATPIRTLIRAQGIAGTNVENLARQFKKYEQQLEQEAVTRRDALRKQAERRNSPSEFRELNRQIDFALRSPLLDAAFQYQRSDAFRGLMAAGESWKKLRETIFSKGIFEYLERDRKALEFTKWIAPPFNSVSKK